MSLLTGKHDYISNVNVHRVLGTVLSTRNTKVKEAQWVFKSLTTIITELGASPPLATCR